MFLDMSMDANVHRAGGRMGIVFWFPIHSTTYGAVLPISIFSCCTAITLPSDVISNAVESCDSAMVWNSQGRPHGSSSSLTM